MRRIGLAALVLVCGCTGTAEDFWRELMRAACKYNRDCAGVEVYGSVATCADDLYVESVDPPEFAELCPGYDEAVGTACVKFLRGARDGCGEVVVDPAACREICGPASSILFTPAIGPTTAVPIPAREGE